MTASMLQLWSLLPFFLPRDIVRTLLAIQFEILTRRQFFDEEGRSCLLNSLSGGKIRDERTLRTFFRADAWRDRPSPLTTARLVIEAYDLGNLTDAQIRAVLDSFLASEGVDPVPPAPVGLRHPPTTGGDRQLAI